MTRLTCIIVDDEPASAEIVEQYVNDCPHLELQSTCRNAFEAMEVLDKCKVDLLLLDINMPKLSGMSFYKSLTHPPMVIFTTAYPQYAVEGFEVDAIDYLLKPFSFERFLKSVNKAVAKRNKETNASAKHIMLKADKNMHRILVSDITHLMAVADYVKVHYDNRHILVHSTFQNIIKELPEKQIIRVHKSYAVALDKIDVIAGNILKIQGADIPIGQTYRPHLMSALDKQNTSQ